MCNGIWKYTFYSTTKTSRSITIVSICKEHIGHCDLFSLFNVKALFKSQWYCYPQHIKGEQNKHHGNLDNCNRRWRMKLGKMFGLTSYPGRSWSDSACKEHWGLCNLSHNLAHTLTHALDFMLVSQGMDQCEKKIGGNLFARRENIILSLR